MNPSRVVLAALGAFVAYFALGGLAFALLPLRTEFLKYPAVYRSKLGQMSFMPVGMVAMLVAMLVLAVIYAMLYQGGSGIAEGARFGGLIGISSETYSYSVYCRRMRRICNDSGAGNRQEGDAALNQTDASYTSPAIRFWWVEVHL
jgi:hypothetical protein